MEEMQAYRGIGTVLKVGTGTPVAVGGLTSIGGLELSAETIDVTTLDSDGGYREFIPGFKDAGEVSLEGYYRSEKANDDEGGQAKLYSLFESGETEEFAIVFPPDTKTTWKFKGIVTGFGTSVSLDDPLTFSATVKVSGKPSLVIEA